MLCVLILCLAIPVCSLAETYTLLKPGMESGDVLTMQTALKDQGYYMGTLSGHFGTKTEDAVKKFQKKNDLSADGVAGQKTLEKLYEDNDYSSSSSSSGSSSLLSEGSQSSAVLSLQTSLKSLGFYNGSLTGNYGSITAEAVRKFQRKHGRQEDTRKDRKPIERLFVFEQFLV